MTIINKERLYSLPTIYDNLDTNTRIYRDGDAAIKHFDENPLINPEIITMLKNKEAKMQLLLNHHLMRLANCKELYHDEDLFCGYAMDYIEGESLGTLRGYKYSLKEKVESLQKALLVLKEAHKYNILINDVHYRNFKIRKTNADIIGFDIDNFQVGNYLADNLPDFMDRFVSGVDELSIQSDMLAFGLMTLEIICPKNIDFDLLSVDELLEYIENLDIPYTVCDNFISLINGEQTDIDMMLQGLNNENDKVVSLKPKTKYY